MSKRDNILKKAAKHWSSVSKEQVLSKVNRWWLHQDIVKHINKRVCGEPIPGLFAGFHQRIQSLSPVGGFARGISIGCGNASKELNLVHRGIVQQFDLFEISDVRIYEGEQKAKDLGILDQITFHCEDGFKSEKAHEYNLVYWNNSLHHMLDVDDAILKSKQMLVEGGLFAMDDFVGPSRFQWSEANLKYANDVRSLLSNRFFDVTNGKQIEPKIERPTIERMIQIDPTEAADSSSILPSLKSHFPSAEIVFTGGCIYHLALNDVLNNFQKDDLELLESLLLLDDALIDAEESHYGVAFATK